MREYESRKSHYAADTVVRMPRSLSNIVGRREERRKLSQPIESRHTKSQNQKRQVLSDEEAHEANEKAKEESEV